jgi:hemerythrin-like domain-containing protein
MERRKMMPVGPLMIEHRLIERMIAVLRKEAQRLKKDGAIDISFIRTAVDFFRTYADMCHHGKEEDLLFRDLKKKTMLAEHKKLLEELIEEHAQARKLVGRLSCETEDSREDTVKCIKEIDELYTCHIEKEDKRFFLPVMVYFSKEEQEKMLEEFLDFDRTVIHKKYSGIVENLESDKGKKGS